jgi:hypothetical protein
MADLVWRIERIHVCVVAPVAAAGAWVLGTVGAASVALGGTLVWLNVWLFKQLFSFLIRPRPGNRRLAIALLFAKLPLLWVLFWLAATASPTAIDGIGLAAGITCFPIAVVVVALMWRLEAQV